MRRLTTGLVLMALALAAPGANEAGAGSPTLAKAKAGRPAFVEDAVPPYPSLSERLGEIRRRVQNALEYPPIARLRDKTGETVVRFEIGPDGLARHVRVVHSSGLAPLDSAAARAVAAAGVLPRIYGPLEIPVHFELE
jgi:TonB family protein